MLTQVSPVETQGAEPCSTEGLPRTEGEASQRPRDQGSRAREELGGRQPRKRAIKNSGRTAAIEAARVQEAALPRLNRIGSLVRRTEILPLARAQSGQSRYKRVSV